MPNWVINNVSATEQGSPVEDVNPALWQEIVNFVKTQPADVDEEGEQDFDFRSIVPQPAGLYEDVDVPQQTGLPDWYSWCCEHWGTKWNASDPHKTDWGFTFNTAWSTPLPVIEALSTKFPTVAFSVEFADEDLGNNCGIYTYENGERTYEEYGTYEFACDLWGYEPEPEEETEDAQ